MSPGCPAPAPMRPARECVGLVPRGLEPAPWPPLSPPRATRGHGASLAGNSRSGAMSPGCPTPAAAARRRPPPPSPTPARGVVVRAPSKGASGAWAGQGGRPLAGLLGGPGPCGCRGPGCLVGRARTSRCLSLVDGPWGAVTVCLGPLPFGFCWLGKPRQSTTAQVSPNGGAVGLCPTIGGRGTAAPLGEPIKKKVFRVFRVF